MSGKLPSRWLTPSSRPPLQTAVEATAGTNFNSASSEYFPPLCQAAACPSWSAHETISECLALLTAYPVALLQQIRGNTCEPAITRYCQDVARALHRLRNGDDSIIAGPFYWDHSWIGSRSGSGNQFATVEYFFEVFSLRLQMEFSRQAMRTKTPSLASQHIIYSLRNHFENLVDLGHLDDRRTPIIRTLMMTLLCPCLASLTPPFTHNGWRARRCLSVVGS